MTRRKLTQEDYYKAGLKIMAARPNISEADLCRKIGDSIIKLFPVEVAQDEMLADDIVAAIVSRKLASLR